VSEFWIFLQLGFKHIFSFQAYDHLLFVLVLTAPFQIKEWKLILVLLTAFTVGHSLTLALSVLNIISFNSAWIEFFIPITIFISALWVLFFLTSKRELKTGLWVQYAMTLLFGTIHGMGFSNNLKPLLGGGSCSLLSSLFSFNLGVEFGQIGIVLCIASLLIFTTSILKLQHKWWSFGVTSICLLLSIQLIFQTIP